MQCVQWVARQFPVLTKFVQFGVNVSNNKTLKCLLHNVGGDTFTDAENASMVDAVCSAMGGRVDSIECIGCGTIGRVYRVNDVYAVKVKIPGILEKIEQNLAWILWLAKAIDVVTGYYFHLFRYVNSIGDHIFQQHDFAREAENAIAFQASLDHYGLSPMIRAPRVYTERSNENVIVMEYIDGTVLADCSPDVCKRFVDANPGVYKQLARLWIANIVLCSRFHLDLHAGNVILTDANLTVIDFGLCCPKLETKQVMYLLNLLNAYIQGDPLRFARHLAREYFVDAACTVPLYTHARLKMEFEYMVVHNFHSNYELPVGDRIVRLFRAISAWGAKNDVYGTSTFAAIEMGVVQTLGVFSHFGLQYPVFRDAIRWSFDYADCVM